MTEYPALALLGDIMRDAAPDDRSIFTPERIRFVMELMPGAPPQIADIRARLTALTGSSQFRLEPLFGDGGDPSFLVFSPDGIDRTLPDDAMFAIAEALRDRLGLLSCEPDIGAAASSDPSDQPLRGTEGVIGDIFCWAQGKAPDDKEWALRKTQVLEAWARSPGRGQGITIAQPDTGIVDHIELSETTIDHSRTLNLIEGGTDPTDPLSSRMSNPGHGTATASVAASGEGLVVKGSAPRATAPSNRPPTRRAEPKAGNRVFISSPSRAVPSSVSKSHSSRCHRHCSRCCRRSRTRRCPRRSPNRSCFHRRKTGRS